MKIVATNLPVRVDLRRPGKFYNVGPADQVPFNNDTHSSYPFDSLELAPGDAFDADGVEIVRAVELTGAAEAT